MIFGTRSLRIALLVGCQRHVSSSIRAGRFDFHDLTRIGLRLGLNQYRKLHTTPFRFQQQQGKKKPDDDPLNRFLLLGVVSTIATFLILLFQRLSHNDAEQREQGIFKTVTWKEFFNEMLAKGEVEQIVINPPSTRVFIKVRPGAVIKGQVMTSFADLLYVMETPSIATFEENLRKAERDLGIPANQGVLVVYNRPSVFSYVLLYALLGLAFYTLMRFGSRGKIGGGMFTNIFDSVRKARFRVVDPSFQISENLKVKFSDVLGLHEAKIEIKEFVDYLKVPEYYTKLGAKLPKGALLLGPPGCGKTLLAKAVASEANVPFLATNGTEFVEMIGGLGAARVRDLFKEAKRRAPCMIYIDEIDAVGRKRGGIEGMGGHAESEQTLNQLLVEMDGMEAAKGVVIIASTNRADILDKALLRRGRFDRHINIDLPTLAERHEIFEYYLKKIKLDKAPGHYSMTLAKLTPGFTGADIANVCNEAAIKAATAKRTEVVHEDIFQALDRVLSGPEKRSTTVSPEEKEAIAYRECGKALVGWLLKYTDALIKISIVPRTLNIGIAQYSPEDRKLYSQEELFDRMCMVLGGRAAENLVFSRPTTGSEKELKRVTQIAYDQVKNYGMSRVIGPLSFAPMPDQQEYVFDKPYSQKLAALIDAEANAIVWKAYTTAEDILRKNFDKLNLLAGALLKKETITYDDIEKLIGPPPYGKKKTTEVVELELPAPMDDVSEKPPKEERSDSSERREKENM